MADEILWLREADVAVLLTLDTAIEVLADSYRLRRDGEAASMRRTHVRDGDSIHHAVGGALWGAGVTGTKTWTYTPGGASPLLVIFALADGSVEGVIEAFALGQMRTAATTALGTRSLARPESAVLALLGTGRQAVMQARAVAAVRPISKVRLFGRDGERRGLCAERLEEALGVSVEEFGTVAEATRGADIVNAITRSPDPIVSGEMLADGTHLNAVGAVVAGRREIDETGVGRCSIVVADSVEQAADDAGELLRARDAGTLDWNLVRGLDEVVDLEPAGLRSATDVSLFKALGVGLSDVALGAEVLRRARAEGAGMKIKKGAVLPRRP